MAVTRRDSMNIAAAVAVSTASIATGAPPGEGDELAPESSPLTRLGRNPGAFEPPGNGPNGAEGGPDVVPPLEASGEAPTSVVTRTASESAAGTADVTTDDPAARTPGAAATAVWIVTSSTTGATTGSSVRSGTVVVSSEAAGSPSGTTGSLAGRMRGVTGRRHDGVRRLDDGAAGCDDGAAGCDDGAAGNAGIDDRNDDLGDRGDDLGDGGDDLGDGDDGFDDRRHGVDDRVNDVADRCRRPGERRGHRVDDGVNDVANGVGDRGDDGSGDRCEDWDEVLQPWHVGRRARGGRSGRRWLEDRRHDIGDRRDDRSQHIADRTVTTEQIAEPGRPISCFGGAGSTTEHGEEREQHDAREGDADDAQHQLRRGHRHLLLLRHALPAEPQSVKGSPRCPPRIESSEIVGTAVQRAVGVTITT